MGSTNNVNWVSKTLGKIKKRLKKVNGNVSKIEKHVERADKALEEIKAAAAAQDNSGDGGKSWITLPTTLIGWTSNTSRFRGGMEYAEVILPKKGFRSNQGVNIKYDKLKGFPATTAELSYDLFVDKDWDPVKGGKLPGLIVNKGTGGKDYAKNDASYRIMWRRGGQLVGYLYPCTDQGNIKKNQGREFLEACNSEFPDAGIDLWRNTKEKVHLKKGEWNSVTMGWTLNDPKTSNAKIWLVVNGKRLDLSDGRITDASDKNKCSGIQWSMWYGGSNASWAPSKDQSFKFKNIRYRTSS